MIKLMKLTWTLALAVGLSGCIFYGHPYHRRWHPPYGGYPGYYR